MTGINTGIPLASLKRPAEYVMLLESNATCANLGDWNVWKNMGGCDAQWFNMHRGRNDILNRGFFDGHAKAMKMVPILGRKGARGASGTCNMFGLEEDNNWTEWVGQSWWLGQDQADNICDFYK